MRVPQSLGGFPGDETSGDERDTEANPTTLSGAFNDDDAAFDADGDGIVEFFNSAENALNVVEGEGVSAVGLDGFTIESPMTKRNGRWEYIVSTTTDLRGHRVAVGTDHGGEFNTVVK